MQARIQATLQARDTCLREHDDSLGGGPERPKAIGELRGQNFGRGSQ